MLFKLDFLGQVLSVWRDCATGSNGQGGQISQQRLTSIKVVHIHPDVGVVIWSNQVFHHSVCQAEFLSLLPASVHLEAA